MDQPMRVDTFDGFKPKHGTVIGGAYKLIHKETGKFYVGSSGNFYGRRKSHIGDLRRNIHPVKELQRLYNDSPHFIFEFILTGLHSMDGDTREEAYNQEQILLDRHWGSPFLLNASSDARKPVLPPELEALRIERVKEAWKDPEFVRKMSEASQLHRRTEKARQHQSGIALSQWADPEFRAKMTEARKNPDYLERQKLNQPLAKRVIAAGREFAGVSEAAKALGITRNAVKRRCRNPDIGDYYFPAQ